MKRKKFEMPEGISKNVIKACTIPMPEEYQAFAKTLVEMSIEELEESLVILRDKEWTKERQRLILSEINTKRKQGTNKKLGASKSWEERFRREWNDARFAVLRKYGLSLR